MHNHLGPSTLLCHFAPLARFLGFIFLPNKTHAQIIHKIPFALFTSLLPPIQTVAQAALVGLKIAFASDCSSISNVLGPSKKVL